MRSSGEVERALPNRSSEMKVLSRPSLVGVRDSKVNRLVLTQKLV